MTRTALAVVMILGTITAAASGDLTTDVQSIEFAAKQKRVRIDANGNPTGRFICGAVQCRLNGISDCAGRGLRLALNWAKAFPHTSAAPGVVVVQRRHGRALGGSAGGHVSKIVSLTDNACRAVVQDEKGTYERDVCKGLVAFVRPE